MPTKRVVARPKRKNGRTLFVGVAFAVVAVFIASGVAFASFGLATSEDANDHGVTESSESNNSTILLNDVSNNENQADSAEAEPAESAQQEVVPSDENAVQNSTVDESENVAQDQTSSLNSYVGYYQKMYGIEWAEYDASYQVSIESIDGDNAIVSLCRAYPNGAYFDTVRSIPATLSGNVLSFSFAEDDQLNSGYGTIELYDGYIVVNVVETYHGAPTGASLATDPPITIYKVSDTPMSL